MSELDFAYGDDYSDDDNDDYDDPYDNPYDDQMGTTPFPKQQYTLA